jgi:hypothetical protein
MTNELNSHKIDEFGDFEIETAMDTLLEVGPSAATGCFMEFARFADPESDEDVRKLIEGQEHQNTKKEHQNGQSVCGKNGVHIVAIREQ